MTTNLSNKRKLLYLALAACALSITAGVFYPLYLNALEEARGKLENTARAQAALIDSVSRTLKKQGESFSPMAHRERVLAQISESYRHTPGIGKTGISMVTTVSGEIHTTEWCHFLKSRDQLEMKGALR